MLDQYHKNKAIMSMVAGITGKERENFDREIRRSLNNNEKELFEQLTDCLCSLMPERKEEILKNGQYLAKYIEAIAIRKTDVEANNGGCTEPHISHILASRLSTRPMAWSGETLTHLAPILAGNDFNFAKQTNLKICRCPLRLPKCAHEGRRRGAAPDSQALILSGISALTTKLPALKKF